LSKSRTTSRYQAILAYDGTAFHGSQRQAPNIRTVQGEIETVLRQLAWTSDKAILFAGRTDAGVHASGQIIAFDLDWKHSEGDLNRALNSLLPQDIALKEVKQTRADFHPRYDALERHYVYRIYFASTRDPLRERYAWRVSQPLNLELLQTASQDLLGVHDFAALGSPHKPGGSTIREIQTANWTQTKDEYFFEVHGNAFLYHMVRHIVELLVAIGQKREKEDAVAKYLQNPDGPPAPGLAPAQGLTLKKVVYE